MLKVLFNLNQYTENLNYFSTVDNSLTVYDNFNFRLYDCSETATPCNKM